jgi:hypothetical protein
MLSNAYFETSYAFLALPSASVGSANIRNAASPKPEIALYAAPDPSHFCGRMALAINLPGEYLAALAASSAS